MSSDVAPFEFLQIVKESAYGTLMTSPAAGVDSIYIRLAGANRFTMRPKPTMRSIKFGGGFDVAGYRVSDQTACAGDLQVELCYTQSQLLLDWAATEVNAGQTLPWVTTEPPGDLASCTVYHGVMRSDGTVKRRRYQGVKVTAWSLPSSAETGTSLLKLSLRAQRAAADPDATAFPAPADTSFPTDPILFYQLSGALTVGGSALLYPLSVSLDCTNMLDGKFFASQYLTFDRLRGRETKAQIDVLYTATPNWRADFEALTTRAAQVAWTNTTHTITLNLGSNVILDSVEDDLSPGQVYLQKLSYELQYDTGAAINGPLFTFA